MKYIVKWRDSMMNKRKQMQVNSMKIAKDLVHDLIRYMWANGTPRIIKKK